MKQNAFFLLLVMMLWGCRVECVDRSKNIYILSDSASSVPPVDPLRQDPMPANSCSPSVSFPADQENATKKLERPSRKGRCSGDASCSACTSCRYCMHCSEDGGTCGVCE